MLRRPPQSRRMAINPATSAQRKTAAIDAEPIEAVARVGANVSSEEDERCERALRADDFKAIWCDDGVA